MLTAIQSGECICLNAIQEDIKGENTAKMEPHKHPSKIECLMLCFLPPSQLL